MSICIKGDNPVLAKMIAEGKIDTYKITVDLLEDLEAIRQKPESEYDEKTVRRADVLMRMFNTLTAFISKTPALAEERPKAGNGPKVTGAKNSKVQRKKDLVAFKMPRPSDFPE